MRIVRNTRLSKRTSFGVGGSADTLCITHARDVRTAVRTLLKPDTPLTVLGKGTNVLISDDGLRGTTLALTRGEAPHVMSTNPRRTLVSFDAGMVWDDAVAYAVSRGLQGIECLSGVPGTVGAAPVQNIGCYGQQISDCIHNVEVYDVSTDSSRIITARECGFGYRESKLAAYGMPTTRIITRVVLSLNQATPPHRTYADIIEATRSDASISDVRRAVLRIRRKKAMLAGMVASAGSFFKTPRIDAAHFDRIRETLENGAYNSNWFWRQPDDTVKVAAGRIVERFFPRGMRLGRAGISPKHALALVAYRGARASDIVTLARRIQETVADRTGVILEPEVRLLGFDSYPFLR